MNKRCTALEGRATVRISTSRDSQIPTDGGPNPSLLVEASIREIWLLRLRALLARAHGEETRYRDYRNRYRDMAKTLGFDGHIEWAAAMT